MEAKKAFNKTLSFHLISAFKFKIYFVFIIFFLYKYSNISAKNQFGIQCFCFFLFLFFFTSNNCVLDFMWTRCIDSIWTNCLCIWKETVDPIIFGKNLFFYKFSSYCHYGYFDLYVYNFFQYVCLYIYKQFLLHNCCNSFVLHFWIKEKIW